MKKFAVNIALISVLAILCIVLAVVSAASARSRSAKTCQGVAVEFADRFNFVTEEDIIGYLHKYYGSVSGTQVDSVDLARIESILDVQSAILKSEAYMGEDGMLNIIITQREPVVRFQKENNGFYADERGFIFPLQRNYTSMVPVIDGAVPLFHATGYKGEPQGEKEQKWMSEVMELVAFLNKNRQWAENIVQISVDRNGDLIMIPREGKEKFLFGECTDIEKKFARIEKYYQYIKPLDKDYGTVIVKYEKQIVCRK